MDETKTLALLLVAAIVVSLGGTVVSLNRLGELEISSVTGRATDEKTGNVSLEINSSTSITVTQSLIDFGNGFQLAGCNNCTMYTNSNTIGASFVDAGCCGGEWATANATGAQDGIWIENTGTEPVSVQINTSVNSTDFFGDPGDSLLQYNVKPDNQATCDGTCSGVSDDDTTASCSTGAGLQQTTGWNDFDKTQTYICGGAGDYALLTGPSEDEIVVDVLVRVPTTASTGLKEATMTFTGTGA